MVNNDNAFIVPPALPGPATQLIRMPRGNEIVGRTVAASTPCRITVSTEDSPFGVHAPSKRVAL